MIRSSILHKPASRQAFFEVNCAACHGRDADGSGLRASAMDEAKPRMLVNFDWINSRDDLRLIRSIKYGVGGTSMTPWGDQTNALQRLQLVMFIRSLSQEKKDRRIIEDAIYASFDRLDQQLEEYRALEYKGLEKVEMELKAVQEKKDLLYRKAKMGENSSKELLPLVDEELTLLATLHTLKNRDDRLHQLRDLLKKERELYLNLGLLFCN